jgi:hypothetical protein
VHNISPHLTPVLSLLSYEKEDALDKNKSIETWNKLKYIFIRYNT